MSLWKLVYKDSLPFKIIECLLLKVNITLPETLPLTLLSANCYRNFPWAGNPLPNVFKPWTFVRSLPPRKGGYSLLEDHECMLFHHQGMGTVSVYNCHSRIFLPEAALQFQTSFTDTLWVLFTFSTYWFMKRMRLPVICLSGCQSPGYVATNYWAMWLPVIGLCGYKLLGYVAASHRTTWLPITGLCDCQS